ncbi:hypothetical protein T484DRAFT_2830277 [Baffinella frigidus]|nr:hypothetical protein T484DRAFT_2830277 [Cryptophyta sp. CCMP2293]
MTIQGSGFWYSSAARILEGTALEVSDWVSTTAMLCKVPAGVNVVSGVVAVTAGIQVGSATEFFTYDAPISSFKPANFPTAGNSKVSIFGSSFGAADYSDKARLGGTQAEASGWVSDSAVTCRAAAGVRATLSGSVTVGSAIDSMTEAVSYDAPVVSGVTAAPHAVASGVTRVDHAGGAFGSLDYSPGARVGASACGASAWVSDSAVVCMVAASFSSVARAVVTVGERAGTWSSPFSYSPILLSVSPANHPTPGGSSLLVYGAEFGGSGATVQIRARGTACERSLWVAETSIVCRVPSGGNAAGGGGSVVATVAGVSATLTDAMSYDVAAVRRTPGHDLGKDAFSAGRHAVTSFTVTLTPKP